MKRLYWLYSDILPQLVEELGSHEINPQFVDELTFGIKIAACFNINKRRSRGLI